MAQQGTPEVFQDDTNVLQRGERTMDRSAASDPRHEETEIVIVTQVRSIQQSRNNGRTVTVDGGKCQGAFQGIQENRQDLQRGVEWISQGLDTPSIELSPLAVVDQASGASLRFCDLGGSLQKRRPVARKTGQSPGMIWYSRGLLCSQRKPWKHWVSRPISGGRLIGLSQSSSSREGYHDCLAKPGL